MEVNGPGPFFETFMDSHDDEKNVQVPAKEIYAEYAYEAKEYFVSGMNSKGQPYKTRIVIRKPKDNNRFRGVILAESMHPSGNPWVFHNTHVYSMTTGVIGLELLTAASPASSPAMKLDTKTWLFSKVQPMTSLLRLGR
jgi:Alpha/beta hydrolase domain